MVQKEMCVAVVQKGSACGHWYMKVGMGDAVLNPTDLSGMDAMTIPVRVSHFLWPDSGWSWGRGLTAAETLAPICIIDGIIANL